MDDLSSQIAQLQTQVQLLPELISTVARLSSENDSLRRTNECQDRLLGELSRAALPGGHWIWEGRNEIETGEEDEERGGRWSWSLEKYRPPPPKPRTGPPLSLESLPVELIDLVVFFLPRSDQLVFARCSLRILTRVVDAVYGSTLALDSKNAALFVSARITKPSNTSDRIRTLLLPSTLHLRTKDFHPSYLLPLHNLRLPADASPLPIQNLTVLLHSLFPSPLSKWAPVLRLLDPKTLSFSGRSNSSSQASQSQGGLSGASTVQVTSDDLSCTNGWMRLSTFWGYGANSIPITTHSTTGAFEFGLSRCLERAGAGALGGGLSFQLVTPLLGGGTERVEVKEGELVERVGGMRPVDRTRARKGMHLKVAVAKSGRGGSNGSV